MATRSMPKLAAVEQPSYQWAAFALGFFLQFNLVPTAWHIPITRFTQLLMLPCIAFLVHRLASRPNPLPTLLYCAGMLLLVVLHLAFSGTPLAFGGGNIDLAASVGYALYLLGGVGLYIMLAQRSGTSWFCWGILIGGLFSLLVFVMEANGLTGLAKAIGLTQPTQSLQKIGSDDGFTRLTGMWGHANEVGHVLAIAAPAAGYLYVSRRERMPLVLLGLITMACFFFTANRGGVIAVIVTGLAMLVARKERVDIKRKSFLFTMLGVVGVCYALYFLPSPDFIYARFAGDSGAINSNASGRLVTTRLGIDIALHHPFGMGVTDWRAALERGSGFQTPHNGFISMTNGMGIPFLLMCVWALIAVTLAGLRQPRKLSLDIFLMLAAVQMAVSFMFEELSYVDSFMMISALIMARVYSGAVNLVGRGRGRGAVPMRRKPDAQAQPAL
ncbi:O-antigen ligase family protein [Sphingomonas sp. AP4-R1]|uniref:O-antigen ligase family protein n=1 Tax=Sphingomonas sp. AP4-R1 TaxID=2735134 RepID=UPI001493B2F8|nr:O-antigen ligase family protein [Sphingomonas sp. AP4-R1]QJU57104.1 O-antigen ligase family protein [Sphingomonas sp. AP4-R1]